MLCLRTCASHAINLSTKKYKKDCLDYLKPHFETVDLHSVPSVCFQCQQMTVLGEKKREQAPQFSSERDTCLKLFEKWTEQDQIEFVEHLLSRMCHHQHGHINTYLKPMLQRDFISMLPSKF